jgi:hypothetical protein
VICLSVLDVICSSILLVCMIRLIPAIIIMLYYCLFRIKSFGKLLIFSTVHMSMLRVDNSHMCVQNTPKSRYTAVSYISNQCKLQRQTHCIE